MVWNRKTIDLEKVALSDFHGHPRTSSWISRHSDVAKIADFFKLIRNPKILDAGCGNGFNSMLLAKEELKVKGVDSGMLPGSKIIYSQIENLELEEENLENGPTYKGINGIFNSWMMQNQDLSSYFYNSKPAPNVIVYVKSRSTGMQPGMPSNHNNTDTYETPFGYVEADRWGCLGNDNFSSEDEGVFKPGNTGEIIVQANKEFYDKKAKGFQEVTSRDYAKEVTPYGWEKEFSK